VPHVSTENSIMLACSRTFLEALIRRRILALPNVSTVAGQATGLTYRDGAVSGVRYLAGEATRVESTGFAVDAMGRAASAQLPPIFGEVALGEPIGEIETYHQADSRRRNFARLQHFPARLISVGDAVASFNPVYGQGMSAALHASCLSEYLRGGPDLSLPAREFFALEQVVVDAAWDVSTAADILPG
jgi:hypothetical protein